MSADTQTIAARPSAPTGPGETLTSRAYSHVRRDIIEGKLKPGSKLKIEDLREQYEAGASPLREALSLLSSDGLVERIEQRGFRVANVSYDEFADILNVRCWLEEKALREAIRMGTAAWEEALVLAAFRLSKEARSSGGDQNFIANRRWEDCHKAFHMTLISAAGSPTLLGYCNQLYDKNVRYRNLAGAVSYPARDASEEHEAILQATLARDADSAVGHLLDHYRRTGKLLAEALR